MNKNNLTNSLVIVNVTLDIGGAEKISSYLAKYYCDKGWHVTILSLLKGGVGIPLDPRVDVRCFIEKGFITEKKWRYFFKWVHFIRKVLKETKPKAVVAMTFKIGALTIIANTGIHSRVIVREINNPKAQRNDLAAAKICNVICDKADGYIFQNSWEMACHSKRSQRKGRIIVNPVSVSVHALPQKKKKIVCVARMDLAQKRQDIIIKAFALVHNVFPEYSLEFFGDGVDCQAIKKLVKEQALEDCVIFHGSDPKVLLNIQDASMLIQASDFEGMSNTILEGMAMGLPIITSDWNGVENLLTAEENCLMFKRGDYIQLSNQMVRLIQHPELGQKIAMNAELESKRFSYDLVMKEWEQMIEGKNE